MPVSLFFAVLRLVTDRGGRTDALRSDGIEQKAALCTEVHQPTKLFHMCAVYLLSRVAFCQLFIKRILYCVVLYCTVDQLQLSIIHPAASQYTYGMHDLSTGVNYSTHVLADRCYNLSTTGTNNTDIVC